MSRTLSIYLDLMRAAAALMVLLYHASFSRFGGEWLKPYFARAGTPAVIAFFVLSGFVIAWTADKKERTFSVYIVNRLARLWSVVIPALLLTYVTDRIGMATRPEIYEPWLFAVQHPIERLGMSGAFLNQIWFLNIQPLSDGPFWSLGYEWWYYVAFGCFMLVPGPRGIFLAAVACLIMGPKIWLLLPIWLMGVATYRQSGKYIPIALAVPMFLAPIGLIGVFALDDHLRFDDIIRRSWGDWPDSSVMVVTALMFGALVAFNVLAVPTLERWLSAPLELSERPIRWLAGSTLSIYLYHYPLLHFFTAVTGWPSPVVLVLTFASCVLLSYVTERQKRSVRALIEFAIDLLRVHNRKSAA